MDFETMNNKWFGWGLENKKYDLSNRPDFLPFLEKVFETKITESNLPVDINQIELSHVRINSDVMDKFEEIVGKNNLSFDAEDRIIHAYGKSYRDLVRLRKGQVEVCHDAVIYPKS